MSKPTNKTTIGLFVVGAIVLMVVAIGVLGSGRFFTEKTTYVMVFEGSVKGLNVGAPVVFRGVKIGAVSGIHVQFDYATKNMMILVYADFERGKVQTINIDEALAEELRKQNLDVMMREFISRGLRAQLEMQSIVTGQLQIALDFHPGKPAVYVGTAGVQEIPTIPTPLQELTRKLENLPFEEIVTKINSLAEGIAELVRDPELKEGIANLNIALKDVQSLVRNADARLEPLAEGLDETVRDARRLIQNMDTQVASLGPSLNDAVGDTRTLIRNLDGSVKSVMADLEGALQRTASALEQAEKLLQNIDSSVRRDSSLMVRVNQTLREVERAARSMRILADYLESHPEALLRGKGSGGGK